MINALSKDPISRRDEAYRRFATSRKQIWEASSRFPSGYYHRRLREIYRSLTQPGDRVLELGCGAGDLVASVEPRQGVGVDFSESAIADARSRHPNLQFIRHDVNELETLDLSGRFDVIMLSDLVNDLWDVQWTLSQCHRFCHPGTRIILNTYSRLWQPALGLARALRLARRVPPPSWITPEDLDNLLELSDFELLRWSPEILFPLPIPLISSLANRYLAKLPLLRLAALTNVMVARPRVPVSADGRPQPSVSVVVAARSEEGNIERIVEETPSMGSSTELVFVEGGSTDDTYGAIERVMKRNPSRQIRLFRQDGTGKGDAVRRGFAEASGEVLMILDADLTVPPSSLPDFYDALVERKGEFINGVRLVYPMEDRAMRFFNVLGNKFFGLAFSFLLGQTLKDSLCGTKVLWRIDYQRIAANRAKFGDFDPFGDFDLLFGAANLNLKIVDLPVRYRERTYGTTNIQRWRHGLLLLRMVIFAARRIKFV